MCSAQIVLKSTLMPVKHVHNLLSDVVIDCSLGSQLHCSIASVHCLEAADYSTRFIQHTNNTYCFPDHKPAKACSTWCTTTLQEVQEFGGLLECRRWKPANSNTFRGKIPSVMFTTVQPLASWPSNAHSLACCTAVVPKSQQLGSWCCWSQQSFNQQNQHALW